MQGTKKAKIGLRDIQALKAGQTINDAEVLGFQAERQQDAVSYRLRYRTKDGTQRRYTIGRHGAPWTPHLAREEARRILGRVAAGEDPHRDKTELRKAATVADLCADYIKAMEGGQLLIRGRPKKASTIAVDRGRIDTHIKPLLGTKKVIALDRKAIEDWMHAVAAGKTAKREKTEKKRGLSNVRGGKGTATRTMGLLGAILQYAVKQGIRSDNPARGIEKFAENKRDRRLSDAEYAALGKALAKAAEPPQLGTHSRPGVEQRGMWPPALAAIRFIALTGWRSGEALRLTWKEVNFEKRTAFLGDTKTGKSMRPLSHAALKVLQQVPKVGKSPYVFPASRGEGVMSGFISYFQRVAALAGFDAEVVPHTLRHSFASQANDLGTGELTIAMLLGHKVNNTITGRYVHGADAVLLVEADKVARKINDLMGDAPADAVVVPLREIA